MASEIVAKLTSKKAFADEASRIDALAELMEICAKDLPLEKMEQGLAVVAKRLHEHRAQNNGFTPRPIFKSCVEIGITYACIELVLFIENSEGEIIGVALKERGANEQAWRGMKAINGVLVLPNESLESAQERLFNEITSDAELIRVFKKHCGREQYAHIDIHREDTDQSVEGRRANCMTGVFVTHISSSDIARLHEGFVFVERDKFSDESIVDHHRITLKNTLRLRNHQM